MSSSSSEDIPLWKLAGWDGPNRPKKTKKTTVQNPREKTVSWKNKMKKTRTTSNLQPTMRGKKVTKWDLNRFDKKCWDKYYVNDEGNCEAFLQDFHSDANPDEQFYTRCAQAIGCPDPNGGQYGDEFGSSVDLSDGVRLQTSLRPQEFEFHTEAENYKQRTSLLREWDAMKKQRLQFEVLTLANEVLTATGSDRTALFNALKMTLAELDEL